MEFECKCGVKFDDYNSYGIEKLKELENIKDDYGNLLCPKCYIFTNKIYLSFQLIPN